MTDLDTFRAEIKRDEGLRLKPYRDSRGFLTIGYGRNLDHRGISRMEAEEMLENDIAAVMGVVSYKLPWFDALHPVRQRVLLNMAFQMGINGLLGFHKMLAAARLGKYDEAADEMLDSRWAQQTPERAQRLAVMMRTGAVPTEGLRA